MNILFLLYYWPSFGGGETVTRILANEMSENGDNIHVAYIKFSAAAEGDRVGGGVTAWQLPSDDFSSESNREALQRYIKRHDIETVILQCDIRKYVDMCWAACSGHAKIIVCRHLAIHANNSSKGLKGLLKTIMPAGYTFLKQIKLRKSIQHTLDRCDRLVLLSPAFVNDAEKILGRRNTKIRAIPNPLPRCQLPILAKKNQLLFVGRFFEHQKRIRLILEAWNKLKDRIGASDWELVLVGDGPDLAEIREYGSKTPRIRFEGFQNPQRYYETASIFLMASAFEGLPMTLLEAQQRGCVPVVMNSFSSLEDIVIDGVNGMIAEDGNLNDFVEKAATLIDDNGLRTKLMLESIKSVDKFSVKAISQIWAKELSELNPVVAERL